MALNYEGLVTALGRLIDNRLPKTVKRSASVSFEWLAEMLNNDENLTRAVLIHTGFAPDPKDSDLWATVPGHAEHFVERHLKDAPFRRHVRALLRQH